MSCCCVRRRRGESGRGAERDTRRWTEGRGRVKKGEEGSFLPPVLLFPSCSVHHVPSSVQPRLGSPASSHPQARRDLDSRALPAFNPHRGRGCSRRLPLRHLHRSMAHGRPQGIQSVFAPFSARARAVGGNVGAQSTRRDPSLSHSSVDPDHCCPVPLEFKPLFMLHNALLSAGSGLLLALMLEEVGPPFMFPFRRVLTREHPSLFRSFRSCTTMASSTPSVTRVRGRGTWRRSTLSTTL